VLPPFDDYKAWLEWTHRTIAAVLGLLILGVAAIAIVDHRRRPSILWPSIGAVILVGFQAWLGRETVLLRNSGASVTAHLAAAMLLLGLLVYVFVRAGYPARLTGRGTGQSFTLLAAFSAASVYALLLFGSQVTATNGTLVFPDWPLMGGSALPPITDVTIAQVLHRYVAGIVGFVVIATALVAWRTQRAFPVVIRLEVWAASLFLVQSMVGALQIWTKQAPWTQVFHVAFGSIVWALALAAAIHAHYAAQAAGEQASDGQVADGTTTDEPVRGARTDDRPGPVPAGAGPGTMAASELDEAARAVVVAGPAGHVEVLLAAGTAAPDVPALAAAAYPAASAELVRVSRPRWHVARAYVALTKPRIVELLLITTVPAMVLAAKGFPPLALIVWTLVGGSLAAGSANAINCYLDRDIDIVMTRTRRRPLPAHEVEPAHAVVFGIVLGVISFAVLGYFVNLLSAFLALLAIAFYVVVYTMLLKRSTPQNIVIGGAAGALPPVIGWAAVTGEIGIPALILFALVFYWTPPHFWALSLRIRKDYAAAGVPMLPVVRGIPETTRQIALYTLLMVAISLVLWPVARMGLVYLGAAVGLGAVFIWHAYALWRRGASEEASTQGAIRLYRYSISYLSLLFVAIAVDALVLLP
jgi:protoheme IX farnesyltransferase